MNETKELSPLDLAIDALEVGRQMRAAQREYFRTRTHGALQRSKELESLFDQAAAAIINRVKGLAK